MNSTKCLSCGLVNFAAAQNCERCQHDLTVKPLSPLASYRQPPPAQFNQPQIDIQCPFCKSVGGVYTQEKTTTGGIILFIVMLLFLCLPLCWIGLLIKETQTFCRVCKMRLA